MKQDEVNINYTLIGSRISTRRRELRLPQKELASLVGISPNYLSSIENGVKKPSLEILLSLCDNLGITMDYLLSGVMHASISNEFMNKLEICSVENRKRILEIIDVFVREENCKN